MDQTFQKKPFPYPTWTSTPSSPPSNILWSSIFSCKLNKINHKAAS